MCCYPFIGRFEICIYLKDFKINKLDLKNNNVSLKLTALGCSKVGVAVGMSLMC